MIGESVGQALKRWRQQRRLSLRDLGKRTSYSHVYLWEIERGTKPALPEVIAKCDHHLGAGGQLIALAAQGRRFAADVPTTDVGLQLSPTWVGCVETVTTLWRYDAGRRAVLRNVVLVPAAASMAAKGWLEFSDFEKDSLPAPDMAGSSASSVRDMTKTFRRLDNLYGGAQIRAAVVQYLDANVAPGLQNEVGGQDLAYVSAVAEMTQLAGWLAYDSCEHGLAQRYFIQALELARWANDRPLGAEILAAMSHQAIFLKDSRKAVDLAQAAYRTAVRAQLPAVIAETGVMRAHAFALARDEAACVSALTEAESVFEHADRTTDPQWMAYFDEAYLAAISGHCFRTLGQYEPAERFARRSLEMSPGYQRGRLFNQLLLAGTQLLNRDLDQACSTGNAALDLAGGVSSARAVTFIDRFVRDLSPWKRDPRVKEFIERAALVTG